MGKPISVKLAPRGNVNPIRSACFAALLCYMARIPKWGKLIDWYKKLFGTGHHTTFMHAASYFTFVIEGISVGDITFGFHLTSPFYNSSQRSGRYCSAMFVRYFKKVRNTLKMYLMKLFPGYEPELEAGTTPDAFPEKKLAEMEEYIRAYWPEVDEKELSSIMDYVRFGIGVFQSNIMDATKVATDFAKEERPFVKADYLADTAPKFAQEQLRNFIPVLAPTGMVHTVNLITLVALYESAWTPAMRHVTEEMVRLVLEKYPELASMFDEKNRRTDDWAMEFDGDDNYLAKAPCAVVIDVRNADSLVSPKYYDRHPVDKLHFRPELMDNAVGHIISSVSLSVATMGQDQRHRTIRRGTPMFTGGFYLPPVVAALGLDKEAMRMITEWRAIATKVPASLAMILAPYGAMASYEKSGSFLAVDHEQGKRTCWCAQEEIYWLGVLIRKKIENKLGKDHSLLQIFEPPCYRTGKCGEGDRYCGRDLRVREKGDYFPRRKI